MTPTRVKPTPPAAHHSVGRLIAAVANAELELEVHGPTARYWDLRTSVRDWADHIAEQLTATQPTPGA